jgi:hypothetical protein
VTKSYKPLTLNNIIDYIVRLNFFFKESWKSKISEYELRNNS